MTTVTIVYRKDKLNKSNLAPIHIRVIKNRKARYIATGIMIPQHMWDRANKQIKRGFPNAARLNNLLFQRFVETQAVVLQEEATNPQITTSAKIKRLIAGESKKDFFQVADELLRNYRAAGKVGSFDKCQSIVNKLREFVGSNQLLFTQVDVSFLAKYERYLLESKGNKINTVHSNLKFIRRVLNSAFAQDLIDYGSNPFHKFKLKTERTHRAYLSEKEIAALESLELPSNSTLAKARDMFVWNCYAGGLRISDMIVLRWSDFDGSHIHFRIRKTGDQQVIKLPRKALEILIRLKTGTIGEFVFNCVPPGVDINDAVQVDRLISRETAKYNKELKKLAHLIDAGKPISSHTSRHSFATRALRKGMSLDKVQRILSHTTPSITQIYAKLVSEDMDKAMELLND